jgi:RimJ/RimL family protein N-acetyltransferase
VELRDGSLTLRPWRLDDAPAVHAACQDAELLRWLPRVPRPYTLEHARAFIADGPDGPHSFAIEEDGRVAGSIALRVDEFDANGTIGYWCAAEARGRGVTTRALRLLCRYGFDELGMARLELVTDPSNVASQRVAEKVGFRREGVLRSHMRHPDGRRRDSVMFSLLPGELR